MTGEILNLGLTVMALQRLSSPLAILQVLHATFCSFLHHLKNLEYGRWY